MEWLILLLLVPAIVVSVVLFFGFAGCSFHAPPDLPPPVINSIEPTALKTLTVEWTDTDPRGVGFEIRRTKVSDNTQTVRRVDPSLRSIIDDGLEQATQYSYTVRRILPEEESESVCRGGGHYARAGFKPDVAVRTYEEHLAACEAMDRFGGKGLCALQAHQVTADAGVRRPVRAWLTFPE